MPKISGVMLPQLSKKLVLKCLQAAAAAPTIGTTVRNDFDGTPVLARTSAGVYTVTLTGEFSTTKTIAKVNFNIAANQRCYSATITSANVVTLTIFDVATPSAADSGDFELEIETYQ